MGHLRELLADLVKPPPSQERFRGRQQPPNPGGLRKSTVVVVAFVLVLGVVGWLSRGWMPGSRTSVETPPPPQHPPQPAQKTKGFPDRYTAMMPDLPPHAQATPTETVEKHTGDDSWKARMEAQMAVLMEAMKAKGGTPNTPAQATKQRVDDEKREQEAKVKELLEARRTPLFSQRISTKEKSSMGLQTLKSPYTLSAGWLLPTIVEDAITNQAPGIARFLVREDVNDSATGQYTLIPQGATGVVKVTGGQLFGAGRLPVQVLSITLPNGDPMKLPTAHATDSTGKAGFVDQVDRRYGQLLASVLIQGVLRGGTSMMMGYGQDASDRIGGAIAQETATQGGQQVRQFIDTSPIFTIRNGYLASIRLEEQLVVGRPYER